MVVCAAMVLMSNPGRAAAVLSLFGTAAAPNLAVGSDFNGGGVSADGGADAGTIISAPGSDPMAELVETMGALDTEL
jgi:hypothetical protein